MIEGFNEYVFSREMGILIGSMCWLCANTLFYRNVPETAILFSGMFLGIISVMLLEPLILLWMFPLMWYGLREGEDK